PRRRSDPKSLLNPTRRARAAADIAARLHMPHLPSFAPARPEEILLPVKPWFVMLTLILGLIGNLIPVSGVTLRLQPDFLALVLLYWCIQEPRLISVGMAWCLGLLMDVADATVFGQHALAYAVLAYAAEYFRRRVHRFPFWQHTAQLAVLLQFCAASGQLISIVVAAPLARWA